MPQAFAKLVSLLAAPLLTVAVLPAAAQTPINGPYYATPSWDQTLPAATRFVVLANLASQAVMDRETGLVWERTPSTLRFANQLPAGSFGGSYAQERCFDLEIGGRKGWRLPTVAELASLIDRTQSSPTLPVGHPFVIGADSNFWSSTPYYNYPDASRTVNFQLGITGAAGGAVLLPVWCVRGGGDVR